jgi:hypothetical protein
MAELYSLDSNVRYCKSRIECAGWRRELDICGWGGVKRDPSLCIPALHASLKIRDANKRHCLHGLGSVLPVPVSKSSLSSVSLVLIFHLVV